MDKRYKFPNISASFLNPTFLPVGAPTPKLTIDMGEMQFALLLYVFVGSIDNPDADCYIYLDKINFDTLAFNDGLMMEKIMTRLEDYLVE